MKALNSFQKYLIAVRNFKNGMIKGVDMYEEYEEMDNNNYRASCSSS